MRVTLNAQPLSSRAPGVTAVEHAVSRELRDNLVRSRTLRFAIQTCDKGLRSDATNVSLLYISAIALFKLRRLPESLRQFDKLLAVQPDHLIAINERGSVLAEMKEYSQALAAFQKAITLNSTFVDAYLNIGNVFGELGRLEDANLSFEQALTLNPKSSRAWNGLETFYASVVSLRELLTLLLKR